MLIENHFEIILITLIFLFFFIFAKYNFKIAFYLNLLDKPDKKLKTSSFKCSINRWSFDFWYIFLFLYYVNFYILT